MSDNLPEEQLIDDEKPLEQSGGELAPLLINSTEFDLIRAGYVSNLKKDSKLSEFVESSKTDKNKQILVPEKLVGNAFSIVLPVLIALYVTIATTPHLYSNADENTVMLKFLLSATLHSIIGFGLLHLGVNYVNWGIKKNLNERANKTDQFTQGKTLQIGSLSLNIGEKTSASEGIEITPEMIAAAYDISMDDDVFMQEFKIERSVVIEITEANNNMNISEA